MTPRWQEEVLDPATMPTEDIRAELRHDLYVYDHVAHPLSKAAMARRIEVLVEEMDRRVADTAEPVAAEAGVVGSEPDRDD